MSRHLYYLKPLRPKAPAPAATSTLTPDEAGDKRLWLDASSGTVARSAALLDGSNYLARPGLTGLGTSYSVSVWFRPDDINDGQTVFCQRAITGGNAGGSPSYNAILFQINCGLNGNPFRGMVRDDAGATALINGPLVAVGTWYHFVLVRAGNAVSLYVNGVLQESKTAAFGPITTDAVTVGARTEGTSTRYDYFHGAIDQPAIWAGALTAADVSALYNAGDGRHHTDFTSGLNANLAVLWSLEEQLGMRRDAVGSNDLSPAGNVGAVDGRIAGPTQDLDPVQSWVDKVAGIPFSQGTLALRPLMLDSEVAIDFDGLDDRIAGGSGPIVGEQPEFALFAKIRLDAPPASGTAVIYAEEDAAAGVQFRVGVDAAGNPTASYRPEGELAATVTGSATISPGSDHVVAARRDGATLSLYLDGTKVGTAPVPSGTSLAGATATVGGPTATAGSETLDGRINHLFAVGGPLTDADVVSLSSWFQDN